MDTLNRNCFENVFLDALAQERSAIQEIEQEKDENSFAAETVSAPTSKKKLRKKLYVSLCERQKMNLPLNQRENEFLEKYASDFSDRQKTKFSKTGKKENGKDND